MAIKVAELSRVNRERLSKNGFPSEVMKGWYLSVLANKGIKSSSVFLRNAPSIQHICSRLISWCFHLK